LILQSPGTRGDAGRFEQCQARQPRQENAMLLTLALILLVAWLLGIVGTYTIGTYVHILLVMAIVLFLVSFMTGRRSLV
jgi:uncharacterized membrane protein YtjA (UPF0391 family)